MTRIIVFRQSGNNRQVSTENIKKLESMFWKYLSLWNRFSAMYFFKLFVLIVPALISVVKGGCSDHTDCVTCASSSMWLTKCRWCEISRSCHAVASAYNYCKQCSDSSISKLCSVTDDSKCDRNIGNGSKSGNFEPNEAYDALIYSAIAYSDDPRRCAKTLFPEGTTEIVEVIGKKCSYLFKYKECYAVVAISHKMKMIILTYRGTTSTKQLLEEFATVLGIFKRPIVGGGGNVQAYFSKANDQLYTCAQPAMQNLVNMYPTYKVMIAGHSLGGAIASIASARLSYEKIVDKEKTTLYTFGMPRTGDKAYAKTHDYLVPKSWRLVHFRDEVAKSPKTTPFSTSPYHHQREIFYGKKMTPTTDYIECFEYEDKECVNSVSASLSSVDYHREYYGILVGSYCDDRMNRRHKRSDADSDLSHLFTNETCRRIKVSDLPTSSADRGPAFKTITITFLTVVLEAFRQPS